MRTVGNLYVLVPEGPELINFSKVISLNETAKYLWESVLERESFTAEDLKNLILDKYDIDEGTAEKDAAKLLEEWIKAGIVLE